MRDGMYYTTPCYKEKFVMNPKQPEELRSKKISKIFQAVVEKSTTGQGWTAQDETLYPSPEPATGVTQGCALYSSPEPVTGAVWKQRRRERRRERRKKRTYEVKHSRSDWTGCS